MLPIETLFTPLNEYNLNVYSAAFAEKLTRDYFGNIGGNAIEGKEILHFSSIKQINFFILKSIFEKWKKETAQLKSPYFNYQHPEVQHALSKFMNTLSQYISVEKPVFTELVQGAANDTLKLMLNPVNYYFSVLKSTPDGIELSSLKDFSKYLVFNRDIFMLFLKHLEYPKRDWIPVSEAVSVFETVFRENPHLIEPMENRIQQFSAILPLQLESLMDASAKIDQKEPEAPLVAQNPKEEKQHQDYTLNKQASTYSQPTLNDSLKKESNTLLDKLQHAHFNNIKQLINLNQKFLFINQLFAGNASEYNYALDLIEKARSAEEIKNLLKEKYALQYNWKNNEEAQEELFSLFSKIFG